MPETEPLSETQPTANVYSTPAMSAEVETERIEKSRPIRISGFFALLLGLLSFVAVLGAPMIVVPVLAALLALVALRPYAGQRPVGYSLALIGLFAAVLFGVWGTTQRHFRHQLLSEQAVHFASAWLDLLAQGDVELALELKAHPSHRQSATMPLDEYYRSSEGGQEVMREFREPEPVDQLIRAGDQLRWELSRPPVVYTQHGRELVKTVWDDLSGTMSHPMAVDLEYLPPSGSEPAQWMVDTIDIFIDDPR